MKDLALYHTEKSVVLRRENLDAEGEQVRINIPALREKAEKATKGPWKVGRRSEGFNVASTGLGSDLKILAPLKTDGELSVFFTSEGQSSNANFIAAANPETVLELLRQRDVLMEMAQWYSKHSWITTMAEHDGIYPTDGGCEHDKGEVARQAIKDCEES